MKHFIIIFLLFFSTLSFSQSLEADFLGKQWQNFGRTYEQRLSKTKEVLAMAEELAAQKGILTQKINLKDRENKSYPALLITPAGSSLQNREAARVAKSFSQLPLLFSPYDLSFGSNAFFDPNGSKLGVPYDFFTEGITNSSYLHELYHAGTYQKLLKGSNPLWAGVMRAVKGSYVSSQNNQYYFRLASLDELSATALSIKLDTEFLGELHRTLSPREFNQSRGTADQRLGSIYHSLLAARSLAKQYNDIASRALANLDQAEIKKTNITLGTTTKAIYETFFSLDSYSWEIVERRGTHVAIPNGTSFSLYSNAPPTQASLRSRLEKIQKRAMDSEKLFVNTIKTIYVLIEYPDISKTNIQNLQQLAPDAFRYLEQ